MPLTLTDEEWEKAKTELEYMKKWSGWTERELPILHRLILQTPSSEQDQIDALRTELNEHRKAIYHVYETLLKRVVALERRLIGAENA